MLMVSGIVRTHSRPREAAANASAMPVLPLVASTIALPGPSRPFFSASHTIEAPMRHLTEYAGFRPSIFARIVGPGPGITRRTRTSGVCPMERELSS